MDTAVRSLDDTQVFAERVVVPLRKAGRTSGRSVVLGLSGDLGAGKTALVQCVAKVLGVTETVVSSSFVLRSDYTATDPVFNQLIHIDVYRMESADELDTIGWDAVLTEPNTLVIVEWAERIQSRLPPNTPSITITAKENDRVFTTTFEIPQV